MSTEKYEPTPEEVKKAERMILPSQEVADLQLKAFRQELKKLGMEKAPDDLWAFGIGEDAPHSFGFTHNGVKVKAQFEPNNRRVWLDEEELNREDARHVWNSYFDLIKSFLKLEYAKDRARTEMKEEAKTETADDKIRRLGLK